MKAILIDDEPLALHYLEHQLLQFPDIDIVGKYTDPATGKQAVEQNEVDIVFLDIQIPEQNGVELAERLLEMKPGLYVVFVTAYKDYALQAFELNALDYVLKPVGKQRLLKTLQRVKSRMEERLAPPFSDMDDMVIRLFGDVAISIGDTDIPLRWRTTKVQQMFLYLMQNRGQSVHKTVITELLWPELDTVRAHQQLYSAIYYIRKNLAPYEAYFEIQNTSEGYRLKLNRTVLDVDRFEEFFRSDVKLTADTVGQYEQVVQLYKGEYLQEYDYVWAEGERQRLQMLWVQTALNTANYFFHHGEPDKAMALCLDICRLYPLEEEAHFLLMKMFAARDKRSSVHRRYEQLQTALMNELQVQPIPAITEWYEQWKASLPS